MEMRVLGRPRKEVGARWEFLDDNRALRAEYAEARSAREDAMRAALADDGVIDAREYAAIKRFDIEEAARESMWGRSIQTASVATGYPWLRDPEESA